MSDNEETQETGQHPEKAQCRVSLDLFVDVKEAYQKHAESCGETLSAFLRRAAKEQMIRDNQ